VITQAPARLRIFGQGLVVGWSDFTLFWTWQSWIASWLLRTLCQALIWVLLGRMLGNEQATTYLLVGNAVLAGPSSVCWTIAAAAWDRWDGTYPLLVIAPSPLLPAIAGRAFVWVVNGIVTSWVVFLVLGLGFDLSFPPRALAVLPVLTVLICASTFAYSLLVGAFVAKVRRLRGLFNFGSTNLLMALSGVSVPISFWPPSVQVIAHMLPVTHGLRAVRASFAGGTWSEITCDALRELGVGSAWLLLAILVSKLLADAGRSDGSIDDAS
jgi:ABC-2 type transport system permease protein